MIEFLKTSGRILVLGFVLAASMWAILYFGIEFKNMPTYWLPL
jgi:hypothetical protein